MKVEGVVGFVCASRKSSNAEARRIAALIDAAAAPMETRCVRFDYEECDDGETIMSILTTDFTMRFHVAAETVAKLYFARGGDAISTIHGLNRGEVAGFLSLILQPRRTFKTCSA